MLSGRPVIVLYSASPRRRELLDQAGLPFRVSPVDADESIPAGVDSRQVVDTIARRKMDAGLSFDAPADTEWALSADTLVEGPGGLLGKPSGLEEAASMIRSLSGRVHRVHSAFSVCPPTASGNARKIVSGVHTTEVEFRDLTPDEVENYIHTGEWQGAAGAYRIQQQGELLVSRVNGLWSTVVGLPLGPLYGILCELSYPFG